MNVSAVGSSTVAAIAYDRTRELRQLEFNSHAIYQYFGVPATMHAALLRAPAQGSDCTQAMGGKFPYSQIANGPAGVLEPDIAAAHLW